MPQPQDLQEFHDRYQFFRELMDRAVKAWIESMQDDPPTQDEIRQSWYEAWEVLREGDNLMFGCGVKGHQAALFNKLARSLAVQAFEPGGVEAFEFRWYANDRDRTTHQQANSHQGNQSASV